MLKVAVQLPDEFVDAGEFIADVRALETAGADTVWLHATNPSHWVLAGAVGALTERIRFRIAEAAGSAEPVAILQKVTGGRVVTADHPDERWERIPMPPDRQAWTAMVQEYEAADATGVIVPWDPRLIDLLRNPGEEDRSDLLMSTG